MTLLEREDVLRFALARLEPRPIPCVIADQLNVVPRDNGLVFSFLFLQELFEQLPGFGIPFFCLWVPRDCCSHPPDELSFQSVIPWPV